MDNMSQKSYKQYVFEDSLRKGVITEVPNPQGKDLQPYYVCNYCKGRGEGNPKSRWHMIEHLVSEKHNLSVAKNKKPSPPPPPQNRITMLEMENESLKETIEGLKNEIASLQNAIKCLSSNW